MAEESYVDDHFDHFLKTTEGDKQAAAILTLAKIIADFENIGVYISDDPDSSPIDVNVQLADAKG